MSPINEMAATRWALLPFLYRTEKRNNAVRVAFSTEQHRQTPSQQGGQTGRRLRARSGDFSYPDCRSSRRALASQRAGGFAPTQHPQTQGGCENSGDLANHIVLLILIPESC